MITLKRSETASHNVDPQKGFTPLCPDELPVEDGHNIVPELIGQNKKAKYKTFSKDVHPANALWIATKEFPQFSPIEGENLDIRWKLHCASGTKGMELLDGLNVTEYDFFIAKGFEPDMHPYSSCYHDLNKSVSTGLIEWFRDKGVKNIIVGGLALNSEEIPLCVGETIIDLVNVGFKVVLNMGATRWLGSIEGKNIFLANLVEKYKVIIVDSYKDIFIQ